MALFIGQEHISGNLDVWDATVPHLVTQGSEHDTRVTVYSGASSTSQTYRSVGGQLVEFEVGNATLNWVGLTLNGESYILPDYVMSSLGDQSGAQGVSMVSSYSALSGQEKDRIQLLPVTIGDIDLMIAITPEMSGLSVQKAGEDGYEEINYIADSSTLFLSNPTAVVTLHLAGNCYMAVASATEGAVSVFRLREDGALDFVTQEDVDIGIATPNVLTTLTMPDDRAYVLLGGYGSGTITVYEMDANGTLSVTDHILDDLTTRFGGISVLKSIVVGENAYVIAGGNDGGLSLFTLLPDGNLVFLEQVVDSDSLGLMNLNALDVRAKGNLIEIFVTSSHEAGLTQLTVDLSARPIVLGTEGNDALQGTNGSDIIYDAGGEDRLTGGAGADWFVLTADGAPDRIVDFELGVDLIDLSLWAGLYTTDQLEFTYTSTGMELSYGAETLVVETHDGYGLTPLDIEKEKIFNIPFWESDELTPVTTVDRKDPDEGEEADESKGTNGPDTLIGTPGQDVLEGFAGDDHIEGRGANDLIYGGDGNDYISGGNSVDVIYGGAGDDVIYGNTGFDEIYGGDGDDYISGGDAGDRLYGGDGNDEIIGLSGLDIIDGGAGDDELYGSQGRDTISGGDGDDWISGGSAADQLYGGDGDDVIYGNEGIDSIFGGFGDDYIAGGSGGDVIYGEEGDDEIVGNMGLDQLYGGAGDDTLRGSTGDDELYGGTGADRLYGGNGADILSGGEGDDVLIGGSHADTFVFEEGFGADEIRDFESIDILFLSSELTDGRTDLSSVLRTFGEVTEDGYLLNFGHGDSILFQGVEHMSQIENMLIF